MNAENSSTSGKTIWAFDLGKGSIGEAVRESITFLHKASLLIPADFARRGPATMSGTPASKHRMLQTRRAHARREQWLDTVWIIWKTCGRSEVYLYRNRVKIYRPQEV
jgi:hypothetical protein